ncbi:MAG: helix-turn-helix domain-containing GNAT family N-acetyltransferase [Gammaproteobacteria bacterium]|nr:helix-turn-helix domain-containing GNAT family N-acetyltransferase [Gammaproteobacteria bacterium]
MNPAGTARSDMIGSVRAFNRFYTRQMGLLNESLLDSGLSLTEVRVLFELAHRDEPAAADLARDLGVDAGYLSRILKKFEQHGLIARHRTSRDRRRQCLSLTDDGRRTFAPLDAAACEQVAAMLDDIGPARTRALVAAMHTIEEVLGHRADAAVPYVLRDPRPGDIGRVIERHGVLYAREYGWDETFEGLVATIAGQFISQFDRRRERCWIAEREGEVVGSVFLVRESDDVAKLRLLYVEPEARGLGIGRRLVDECIRFARDAGYDTLVLWTNDVLASARRIYQAAGFRLVKEEPHHSFGKDLVGQYWELSLRRGDH